MPIASGARLGHYEIRAPLGKGGMGEVWRARDTRLGREVAVKTLPPEFALDADRLARFEREAKTLASLNHPGIAAIYGLEEHEGHPFLVLELVEGDTLADRLRRGAIPVEESLGLAVGIAGALEAAHRKGIIHRDLKPSNIKITPDGTAKVLDLGLAKAVSGDGGTDPVDRSTAFETRPRHAVLGTPAYMSPQQARGEPVGPEADVWAFGCVLYEMLAGRPAFGGNTVSDVLAAVLAREPDWAGLPPDVHPRMRFLLERCLEKDAQDRYHDVHDALVEIRKVRADVREGPAPAPPAAAGPATSRSGRVGWVAAAALAAVLAGIGAWTLKPAAPGAVARFPQPLPEGHVFTYEDVSNVAVSPDGRRYVYVANRQLYLRNLDEAGPQPVPGVDPNPALPVISPDGQRLAYVVEEPDTSPYGPYYLKTISLAGGSPRTILGGIGSIRGMSWLEDDTLLFVWPARGIVRMPAAGGTVSVLVEAASGEQFGRPQLLPGSDRLLFSVRPPGEPSWDAARIVVQDLVSGERTTIVEEGSDARYLPTGHIVFAQQNTLYAQPFDVDSLTPLAAAVEVESGLKRSSSAFSDTANYVLSANGSLVYATTFATGAPTRDPDTTLAWVDWQGDETPIAGVESRRYRTARISPEGSRVALVIAGDVPNIWLLNLETGNLNQLTFDPAGARDPLWELPDGERILYRSLGDGGTYSMPAAGGEAELIFASTEFQAVPWSMPRDARTLAILAVASEVDVYPLVLPMNGVSDVTRLPIESPAGGDPAFSPNGEWIAYAELGGGRAEINLRPFPDLERTRYRVGPHFALHPVFSADGSRLFYFSGEGIWSVPVEYAPRFTIGTTPELLFDGAYWYGYDGPNGLRGRAWDVHPDGDRFLMIRLPTSAAQLGSAPAGPQIVVILNWLDELMERVPPR